MKQSKGTKIDRRRFHPRKRRYGLTIPAIVLLVVVVYIVVHFVFDKPASGTIAVGQTTSVQKEPTGSVQVIGKYISFSYPDNFSTTTPNKLGGTMVENFILVDRHSIVPNYITVSVLTLPTGKLADDGSYNYRVLNPGKYRPETWQINGSSVALMDDLSDGISKTAFMPHGQLIAEISLTSANSVGDSSPNGELKTVLNSVEWLALK